MERRCKRVSVGIEHRYGDSCCTAREEGAEEVRELHCEGLKDCCLNERRAGGLNLAGTTRASEQLYISTARVQCVSLNWQDGLLPGKHALMLVLGYIWQMLVELLLVGFDIAPVSTCDATTTWRCLKCSIGSVLPGCIQPTGKVSLWNGTIYGLIIGSEAASDTVSAICGYAQRLRRGWPNNEHRAISRCSTIYTRKCSQTVCWTE